MVVLDIGTTILSFATKFGSFATSLAAILGVFFVAIQVRGEGKRYTLELDRHKRDITNELVSLRTNERGEYRLAMEERRLGEANVVTSSILTLIESQPESLSEPQAARPFLLFRLPLSNEGDGPVDVLASLVSARVLSSGHKPGIGLRGRDVEWDDYLTYYWNESSASTPFAGISTTKNMLARPTHFIRLSPHEHGSLRRIDAVNDVRAFTDAAPLYLMYRAFLVIRGYPLGEIMRQLGGHSPDPVESANLDQFQFESIAQPVYARWRQVQEALLNLNRLAFRVASMEEDPLGELTDQDAWRFFLLFHDQFANDAVGECIAKATDVIKATYEGLALPVNFQSESRFDSVRAACRAALVPMLEDWRQLRQRIEACKVYRRGEGYAGFGEPRDFPAKVLEEGYPARIHQDPACRDRWLALFKEGYLVSRPLDDSGLIPLDPRVLEPFVMRIHYFLETPQRPLEQQSR